MNMRANRTRIRRIAIAGTCLALSLRADGAAGQSDDDLAPLPVAEPEHSAAMTALSAAVESARAKQLLVQQQATGLAGERARARAALGGQVRALYRITHPGLSPAVGGMSAVLRHVGRVKRLRSLVTRQAQSLQALEQRAAALGVEATRATQDLEQAQLRLAALRAAPREELGQRDREASHYGLRIVDGSPITTFESQRGQLASPIAGDVHIVPGRVAESDGPGLHFQAPAGTPVRSVAAGRVAFADRYGGYGLLVILDHGASYYSAYGGLGAIEVQVGDDLDRQARIGAIGTDLSPPALFFEIRKGSRTLDPMGWLGY